jgi:aquaporin Z
LSEIEDNIKHFLEKTKMKYVYEFIGTFFLVLTVGMTVLTPGAGPFAPLAIGAILAALIYAGGHISGGHYNPAVSLAVFLRGRLNVKDLGVYWVAQVLAAVAAAFTVIHLKGGTEKAPMNLGLNAILAEFLFTFALCYVVLNVATSKLTEGNSYFGIAIGFTVLAGAYAVGTLSSAAFNPAVAIGQSLMNLTSWNHLWMFLIGNFAGAIAAAFVFRAAQRDESKELRIGK